MVNRLYLTEGWSTATWTGNGNTLKDNLPSGVSYEANGSLSYLNTGDVITLDDGGSGHAGVINDAGAIQIVNQNTVAVYSTASISSGSYAGSNAALGMTGWAGYTIQGIAHHPTTTSSTQSGDIALNSDFGSGTTQWTAAPGSNFVTYGGSQLGSQSYYSTYSGARYASTNTSQSGGGVYQNIAKATSVNQTYCVTAWVRTSGGSTGAYGTLTLFQLGGSYNDSESQSFGPLTSSWQRIQTCGVATTGHTSVQPQFYVGVNGPTLDIDDVIVHLSSAANADFGEGTSSWTTAPNSNFVTYGNNQLGSQSYYSTYSGARYASTNTTVSGGGVYQDISLTISANQTYCATAWVRSSGGTSGAFGTFTLFQTGVNATDSESQSTGALTSSWQQIETCGVATAPHNTLRVQFYPGANAPTLDIDDIDVHLSAVKNADFVSGTTQWTAAPGSNFVTYAGNQLGSQSYYSTYSGARYGSTNTSQSGGGIYQDVSQTIAANRTVCATAWVRTSGGATGAYGTFTLWQLGGSYNDSESQSFGPLTTSWQRIETCGVATTAHTSTRAQFYVGVNGPTLDIDDVDVQ